VSIDLSCSTGKVVKVENTCIGSPFGATPHLSFGWLMVYFASGAMSYVAFTPQSHDWYNCMFWLFLHTPRSFVYDVVFLRGEKVLNCLSKMHSTAHWRVQGFHFTTSSTLGNGWKYIWGFVGARVNTLLFKQLVFFNYRNTSLVQNFNWVCSIERERLLCYSWREWMMKVMKME
jgi:hypothetical protein